MLDACLGSHASAAGREQNSRLECATAIGRPSFMGIANGGRRPYAEGYTRTSARLKVTRSGPLAKAGTAQCSDR